jgi:Pyridine nucleotide-disulphide oxidoreductase, dimerisation domain
MEQGRLAAYHAFGEPASAMPELQPIGIYSILEVSYVGATEVELTRDSIRYEVGISRFRELARGQIAGAPHGMLKKLVSTDDRRLTELVHIGHAVMGGGCTIEYLVDAVFQLPDVRRGVQGCSAGRDEQDAHSADSVPEVEFESCFCVPQALVSAASWLRRGVVGNRLALNVAEACMTRGNTKCSIRRRRYCSSSCPT